MKKLIVMMICVATLAVSVLAADATNAVAKNASPEQWALTLSGVGSTAIAGDNDSVFGVDVSLGRTGKLLLPLEAGIRQSVSYNDASTVAGTKGYVDWTLFTVAKKVDLFAGANIGVAYGNTPLNWSIAPETGLRFWIKPNIAIIGRAEFPYDISNGRFSEVVKYLLGLQVRF